ncbi:hypothetical protein ABZV58_18360 [Nocardia sp. NPDC004654]|uniref:hypothetical protein n=1 Tax=Nocardia sp. NPDC004654 TaxID=3154776 RepID=UPI0033B1C23B
MARYHIQYKVKTLVENAVGATSGEPSFTAGSITFTHWDFTNGHGWNGDAWLAECKVESNTVDQALAEFEENLSKVVSRASLIGQAFIQYRLQPFLVTREDRDVAYFSCPVDLGSVGLMFQENEKKALDLLLGSSRVREEFFLYWNDAVNATGYSSKLLLMFAAVDALIKRPDGTRDTILRPTILGQDLKDKIYDRTNGLRNRLVHGEYLSPTDADNYVELVHKKIIEYFNNVIFQDKLIEEGVVQPQRHFLDNYGIVGRWIRQSDDAWPLTLKKAIEDYEAAEADHFPQNYKSVDDAEARTDF